VWKLDRFGRSLRDLVDLVNELRERGVEFVFHVFGMVAEFKRSLTLEKTMTGLEAGRAEGSVRWTTERWLWPPNLCATARGRSPG
jgi:DNA invertase Pin-like site-specific DNA recombinase